jgi:hypothetical protein
MQAVWRRDAQEVLCLQVDIYIIACAACSVADWKQHKKVCKVYIYVARGSVMREN